jgi:predicted nucleic acid-binding protein
MFKNGKKTFVLLTILLLICSNLNSFGFKITKETYDKIKIGMSENDVLETVGRNPDSKYESEDDYFGLSVTWVYRSAGTKFGLKVKGIIIIFQKNKKYKLVVADKQWIDS